MNPSQQKVVQYLNEAQAAERGLIRVLQSQIAMTPRGSYRSLLETHLRETRDHAARVGRRLEELGQGSNPVAAVVNAAESIVAQALALGKTPIDLLRGSGGEEKVLKNARDTAGTEAWEIAMYTAVERLARAVDDEQTADMAASIRADEEKTLQRILREIPKLTDAVVRAEIQGKGDYDVSTTGAGEAVRGAARRTTAATRSTARRARRVPGVAEAEGRLKGAVASASDLAIPRYDTLNADEIVARLSGLSQMDLAKIDGYERRNQNRNTVVTRIGALRGDEPWPGYDDLTAAEVQAVLSEGDDERAEQVRSYERTHKNRAGVMRAAENQQTRA
jgi:ferritin-like metal-binding protein YciE